MQKPQDIPQRPISHEEIIHAQHQKNFIFFYIFMSDKGVYSKINAMNTFHFGKNLRRIRLEKEISQAEMAHTLDISQAHYSRLENQAEIPADPHKLEKLATTLQVPLVRLVTPDKAEDTVTVANPPPNDTFEARLKEFLKTRMGVVVAALLTIPLVDAVYFSVIGAFTHTDVPDKTRENWAFVAGLIALTTMIVLVRKIRKEEK